ncbi:MAG: hypothetical protein CMH30_00715 [Micavibrio sp.]|nr:hypothetical protein [Micavibrio sp.]
MIDMELQKELWNAAEIGDLAAIRMAVVKGADVEMRDEKERSAINIASQHGQANALSTLLAAKAMARLERYNLPLAPVKNPEEVIERASKKSA